MHRIGGGGSRKAILPAGGRRKGLLNCDITSFQLSGRVISTLPAWVLHFTADYRILEEARIAPIRWMRPPLYVLTDEDLGHRLRSLGYGTRPAGYSGPWRMRAKAGGIDCLNQEAQLDGGNSSQGTGFRCEWRTEWFSSRLSAFNSYGKSPRHYLTVTNLEMGAAADEVFGFGN